MSFHLIIGGWGLSVQINVLDVTWAGLTLFSYAWIKRGMVSSGEKYQYIDGRFSWTVTRKNKQKSFTFQRVIRSY